MQKQSGQTLIETMVALFVMVMGITSALGLANYSLNASTSINKQIIGMGLAREGLEAIKNSRDTNWLNAAFDPTCNCYPTWLNPGSNGYLIPANGSFFVSFNAAAASPNGYWTGGTPTGDAWGLDISSDINIGLYTPGVATKSGSSGFYRQIVITSDSAAPFDSASWPRLLVQSRVWWTDKRCPPSPAWPGTGKCSIQLQTYLTNWKAY